MENSYTLSNKLKQSFCDKLKMVFVTNNNVIIVTEDDIVYEFKRNSKRSLIAFSDSIFCIESHIVKELCYKNVVDFVNGDNHYIARTRNGSIYCWGCNNNGQLGNGSKVDNKKPELNEYLRNMNVNDVKCGSSHSVVLTDEGEVYCWGFNKSGLTDFTSGDDYQIIPIKVNGFDGKKIKAISCGYRHSMALTECGSVYSWGNNKWGQSRVKKFDNFLSPKMVALNNAIVRISCGRFHNLLLTNDGQIYAFGRNNFGQLGNGEVKNAPDFIKLNIGKKFIDIASHYEYNISVAKTNSKIYVWGQYDEEAEKIDEIKNNTKTPKETKYESINNLFIQYIEITYKPISRIFEFRDKFLKNGKYKNHFNEIARLGQGSFGQVFKVEKNRENYFAIQKIKFTSGKNNEILERIREFYAIKDLASTRIVRYFDIWLENEFIHEEEVYNKSLILYIQMELCDETLEKMITEITGNNNLKTNNDLTLLGYFVASRLFIEILEGVNYLHNHDPQIIHRELKPSNILLKKEGGNISVKIADFGLMDIHKYAEQTRTQGLGSLRYMAPEVMDDIKCDAKADIYSLGIILQHLFFIDMYR
jgi:alpha-tubulin suppressor-like RCC1 family protein